MAQNLIPVADVPKDELKEQQPKTSIIHASHYGYIKGAYKSDAGWMVSLGLRGPSLGIVVDAPLALYSGEPYATFEASCFQGGQRSLFVC